MISICITTGRVEVSLATDAPYNPDAAEDLTNRAMASLKASISHLTAEDDYTTLSTPLAAVFSSGESEPDDPEFDEDDD